MATKTVNAKSGKLETGVPDDVAEAMEKVKEPDESTGNLSFL
ncbi:hypothetical protein [Pectobacterium polaris]|nr:hypothetical protein [Pectobacterium polaris]